MHLPSNPIICAIDTTHPLKVAGMAIDLYGYVGAIKLGLEFFTANGKEGLITLANEVVRKEVQAPLFLDLKFHDIPNTVAGAIRAVQGLNPFMMTVHAAGGKAMMQAAIEAAKEIANPPPKIVGVTVLTSLDQNDVVSMGVKDSVADQVKRLAALAQESGLDGVVCSPHEIAVLRRQCGNDFTLVVPGIRPEGSAAADQKRTTTPKEAIDAGATYLVIGRPITGASDPKKEAQAILESLK
jgi:orotidine-5'-phosphate decarboxylase